MLLVLNVVYHGKVAVQVSREIHRSRSWDCQWLKRYDKHGIEGLKDKLKVGRRLELSEEEGEVEYKIKTTLKKSNQGWTIKQIEQLIIQNTGVRYHPNHIYRLVRKRGFKQKAPTKIHVNTAASVEEKGEFKKRPIRYLWMFDTKAKKKTLR